MKQKNSVPLGHLLFQLITAYCAAYSVHNGYMNAAGVFAFWAFVNTYFNTP